MYRLYVCVCIIQEELQSQNHFSCTFHELLASYTQLHVAIPSSGPVPRIHAHCPDFFVLCINALCTMNQAGEYSLGMRLPI